MQRLICNSWRFVLALALAGLVLLQTGQAQVGKFPGYLPAQAAATISYTTVLDTVPAANRDALSNDAPQEYEEAGPYLGVNNGATEIYEAGFEFHLSVPQGSIIDTVYLTLTTDNVKNIDTDDSTSVFCYNVDTAPVFNSTHEHTLSNHAALTADSVLWYQGAGTGILTSVNLKTIVQTVINRVGWASGQFIGFVLRKQGASWTDNENYSYKDFEDGGTTQPRLKVVYH